MFEIITEHFEDNFHEGKEIFICFPMFDFVTVPYGYDLCVDTPDHVVEDVGEEGHHVL